MENKIAISVAGHDCGEVYVTLNMTQNEVILANGRNKTVEHPKRKNRKHVRFMEETDSKLNEMLVKCCTDEAIHQAVLYYKKKQIKSKI